MKVAVIGATGNIGTRVVDRLLREASVTGIVGIASRLPDAAKRERLRYARVDLGTPGAAGSLATVLGGVDVVIHLAWLLQPSRDPDLMERVNLGGLAAVLDAVLTARVGTLVYASSLGAYSPAPKRPAVTEDAATGGIATSVYSRQKARAERRLDTFSQAHPDVRVARIRPAVVLQRQAGAEQSRYFLGRLVPARLLDRRVLRAVRLLPLPDEFTLQVVHAADIADLFVRAALNPSARGAYNGAADPVLDPPTIAAALGMRHVPVPLAPVRALAELSWRARLQPTDPGWVDLGARVPLMDTARARDQLGWRPVHDARDTLREAIDGAAAGAGTGTPPLRPR